MPGERRAPPVTRRRREITSSAASGREAGLSRRSGRAGAGAAGRFHDVVVGRHDAGAVVEITRVHFADDGKGGADTGGWRCLVACSNAYASPISVASSHARPKNVTPAGSCPP